MERSIQNLKRLLELFFHKCTKISLKFYKLPNEKKSKETLLFLNIFIKSFLKYFLSNQRLKKMFDKIFNFIKIKFIAMIT